MTSLEGRAGAFNRVMESANIPDLRGFGVDDVTSGARVQRSEPRDPIHKRFDDHQTRATAAARAPRCCGGGSGSESGGAVSGPFHPACVSPRRAPALPLAWFDVGQGRNALDAVALDEPRVGSPDRVLICIERCWVGDSG